MDLELKKAEEMKQEEERQKANREFLLRLIKEEKLPKARAMNRTERRKLDAAGLNVPKLRNYGEKSFQQIWEDMTDWILDEIYPDFNFDELDNNICSAFGSYIYNLTYGDDLTAKN